MFGNLDSRDLELFDHLSRRPSIQDRSSNLPMAYNILFRLEGFVLSLGTNMRRDDWIR